MIRRCHAKCGSQSMCGPGGCRIEVQPRQLLFDLLLRDVVGIRNPWLSPQGENPPNKSWKCTSAMSNHEGHIWIVAEYASVKQVYHHPASLKGDFNERRRTTQWSRAIAIGMDKHYSSSLVQLCPHGSETGVAEDNSVVISGDGKAIGLENVLMMMRMNELEQWRCCWYLSSFYFLDSRTGIVCWECCKKPKACRMLWYYPCSKVIGSF